VRGGCDRHVVLRLGTLVGFLLQESFVMLMPFKQCYHSCLFAATIFVANVICSDFIIAIE
jgi:hypothetical protein